MKRKSAVLAVCLLCLGAAPAQDSPKKLRVVVFGAHTMDPELACGGLIALLRRGGHEVILAYSAAFRGDLKIGDEPQAVVHKREATNACRILDATPKIFPYANEKLIADDSTLKEVGAWLNEVKPDVVVTHWPLDTHPNHHVTSSLVWQNYAFQGGWNLYFFEIMGGQQTQVFAPDLYLDIGSVVSVKKEACFAYPTHPPERPWGVHDGMQKRRGAECGVTDAEAYVLLSPKKGCALLPLTFRPRTREYLPIPGKKEDK
ncbi:MAG: PIG-L family deacetylase [Planctomycetes bacterium]|nr:PIG-L family deacetylase [Planctomycetota bacterium]